MSEWRRQQAAAGGTIAGHLRSLVFLCWAMLLVVSVTAIASLEVQSENIGRLTLIDGPALDANNSVRAAMTDAQIGLSGYQASGDRGLLQPYVGAHDRTMASLTTLQAKVAQESVSGADAVRLQALAQGQRLAAQRWWANAVLVEQTLTAGGRAQLFVSRSLFATFSAANTALGDYLTMVADQTRLAARSLSSRGELVAVAATLAALLAMLILGGRAARSISAPLTDLRDTMVRQRGGERGARAREDRGSLELRSVAGDFNTLTEANLVLLTVQARDLGTQQITLQIGRAIRRASDTQEALDFMCVAVGEGLGVDRVIATTFGAEHEVRLGAQWQRSNVLPLKDLAMLQQLGGLAEELWLSGGFRAEADLPDSEGETDPATQPGELSLLSREQIGGRAVIMVPVGFDDRLMGMMCVIMVHHPRAWTVAEANVVQAVAGFVAKAIVAAEHQDYQREYVERIETLDRQKSDFLATVSHELRTPLTSIIGYLELLQEQGPGELTGQQQKMLHVIDRNAVRLRSLIEDVMVLSRIEGGVSKAGFVGVSIRAVITRVGEELSVLAQDRGITLEIAAGPRAALVLGDSASLDRAVVNVLSNAIKFSRPAGVVTLGCTLDPVARRVVITCQDHGVGIPAQDLPDLFTRFFRASNATDQSIPGTGLGLSIAKQIVEDHHGGEMRLTSVQDEGTTVVIDLPLYEVSRARGPAGDDPVGDGLVVSEPVGNGSSTEDVFGIRA
jgi:two-component system, OmpR family, phosphate regulon sensor histidine kinase PhoR